MRTSILQKTQLALVFSAVKILWVIDDIGSFFRKIFIHSLRFSTYLFIVFVAITGFHITSVKVRIGDLSSLFTPHTYNVLGTATQNFPRKVNDVSLPQVSAVSVYAVDQKTGTVLVDINKDLELPPASTTKLMTALVALDAYNLDEVLTVPVFCTEIEGQKAGFLAQDYYTVKDLIVGLLVGSSADAACTLATGHPSDGSFYSDFVFKMNEKAKELGMEHTAFTNPVGLDGENNSHHSTAQDLYLLAKEAISDDLVKDVIQTKEATLVSGLGVSSYINNTNELLWTRAGTVGIKTGKTEGAGEVLIYEYRQGKKDIVIVVMRSDNRFNDTTRILDWILANYSWPGDEGV